MESFERGLDPKAAMGVGLAEQIKKVIEGVVTISPKFYDDPNGPYTHTCPFCYEEFGGPYCASMDDIEHEKDCIYLIAKELHGQL